MDTYDVIEHIGTVIDLAGAIVIAVGAMIAAVIALLSVVRAVRPTSTADSENCSAGRSCWGWSSS